MPRDVALSVKDCPPALSSVVERIELYAVIATPTPIVPAVEPSVPLVAEKEVDPAPVPTNVILALDPANLYTPFGV
jgi:hypothetical protein